MRRELLNLLGREPNSAELALIDRAAWLHLRITVMDGRFRDASGDATLHDNRVYCAFTNAYRRCLESLGLLAHSRYGPLPQKRNVGNRGNRYGHRGKPSRQRLTHISDLLAEGAG